jgi:ankyrin repeat protein
MSQDNKTPLNFACERGFSDIVKILIENGAIPSLKLLTKILDSHQIFIARFLVENCSDKCPVWRDQSLIIASSRGQREIVDILIQKGSNLEALDDEKYTALLRASQNGFLDIVERLVEAGSCIDSLDVNGKTALIIAAETGNKGIVEYLTEKGADLNHADNSKRTALMRAVDSQFSKIVDYLVERNAAIYTENDWKDRALFNVFYDSDELFLKYLLKSEPNVNQELYGETPLMSVAKHGDPKIAEILINAGATLNTNILFRSITDGRKLETTTFLIEQANVHLKDHEWKEKALVKACVKGRLNVIEVLVKYNVDVNKSVFQFSSDFSSKSPLMIVFSNHYYKCAKYLIEHGANWIEEQVLNKAIQIEQKDFVEFLLKDAKKKSLSNYISHDDILESIKSIDIFRMLVEEFTDTKENRENLAFIKACRYNSLEVLEILIRKGADVNFQNKKRETPLIIACSSGSNNVVKFLIDKGANVNKQGDGNDTPILKAIRSGEYQIVKILIEHGADLKLENYSKMTPLSESYTFPRILDLIAEELIEQDRDYFFNQVANSKPSSFSECSYNPYSFRQ